MLLVPHPKLVACFLHERRECSVVDMADSRKEMVLDLKVQPTDKPRKDSIAASKIDRCFNLVHGPGGFHPTGVAVGQREGGFLHAVCQLKYDAERHALYERCHQVQR